MDGWMDGWKEGRKEEIKKAKKYGYSSVVKIVSIL